jgi:hypothetical protein
MRLCAIYRTLGKHVGYVAAPATGVSSAASAGSSNLRSHDACAAGATGSSPASRDYQLP